MTTFYDKNILKRLKYFKYNKTCKIRANTPPPLPYLEHLQEIDPSFVTITNPLSNKKGETFCEGLK